MLAIAPAADSHIDAVVALWERRGLTRPWNDPRGDIAITRCGDNAAFDQPGMVLARWFDGRAPTP